MADSEVIVIQITVTSESAVMRSLELLKPTFLCKALAGCKDFHVRRVVRNNIDKVTETDDFVMQNVLDVTTRIAHYMVEEM